MPSLETQLTRDLGIRVPIIQGGMQWVGFPKLVAAVSNAGGLGILTALSQGSPEGLRQAIRETKKLTKNPFGVNITFLPTISPPPYKEYAQVVIDEGIKVAETAGSSAAAPVIQMYKKAGIYVIHKICRLYMSSTADKIIVHNDQACKKRVLTLVSNGFECAGHPGESDMGGLVLLARAAQELKVPFIASGGFANARGLVAALSLGAQGINCGTLFMATTEAEIHENVKKELVRATEEDTIHIFRTMNNTARVHRNKVATEVVAIERRPGGAKFSDIQHLVAGSRGRKVYEEGDIDAGIWSCGCSVGLINEILPCKDLLAKIESEAIDIIEGLQTKIKRTSKL